MTSSADVHAQDHCFGLFDGPDMPIDTADWSTGLAITMSTGAMIYTGADRGIVHVTAQYADAAPELTDTAAWDDIVEISINAPHGNLGIASLETGPLDHPPALPSMSAAGPGTYRVRAHTRGRDAHYDKAVDDTGEQYLLISWPALPAPSLIIRATDWCGYSLRVAQLMTPPPAAFPTEPPEVPVDRTRQETERQAILEGIKRLNPP
jgi:hypothetical protein